MRIVKIKGGIGNQLFQYAFLKSVENKISEVVKADVSQYNFRINAINNYKLNKFNTNLSIAEKSDIAKICKVKNQNNPKKLLYKLKVLIEILLNKKYYFEWDRLFRSINYLDFTYYDGYWQSEKYFSSIREQLLKDITLREISETTKKFISSVQALNTVFIGVRRPYNFEKTNMKKNLEALNQNMVYYKNAISHINNAIKKPTFIVFSNDIEWAKNNLPLTGDVIYRTKEDQVSDEEELIIMKNCKNAIISNSTFNWWGAWLIENDDKIIIAPSIWQQKYESHIIPNDWIVL